MNRISARVFVALLTFMIGVTTFTVWLFLRPPHTEAPGLQQTTQITDAGGGVRFTSKYENPAVSGGHFSVTNGLDDFVMDPQRTNDERALNLSYDNVPPELKADGPDAPTLPGFYLSSKVRVPFERVEVIGRSVYFKTISVGGVRYEFSGLSGEETSPTMDASTKVPFIKGILSTLRDEKLEREEEIKFRHTGTS